MTENGTRTNRVGRHLPTSGGLKKTLSLAREQGLETVQIFVSNPQGWDVPSPRPDAEAFAAGTREIGLSPVVVHSKYLINLAAPNSEHRKRSARALAAELIAASSLGAGVVVVHSGSHGGDGEKVGEERLIEGIVRARELAAEDGAAEPAEPVIENSVGAGTQLCSSFDSLARVAERAGARVCVDTAHAYVVGYDLGTQEGAREVATELREGLGERIALIHLNSPRNSLGSHRDGHERIGEGYVPVEAWTDFFGGVPGLPLVMETPYATSEVDAEQVRLVKELAGGLPLSPGRV